LEVKMGDMDNLKIEDVKNCFVCKLEIRLNKDSFIEVKEYNEGKYNSSSFAHKECFKDYIMRKKDQGKMMAMVQNIFGRTDKMLTEVGC